MKKLLVGAVLFSTSLYSNAGIINSITGADMAGIQVTATFADTTSETFLWNTLSTTLGTSGNDIVDHEGFSGGVFGTDWSLTQQGYSLGNFNAGNIYGAWTFDDNRGANEITSIAIDANGTGIMFDTEFISDLAEDTNGSGQGRPVFAFIDEDVYTGFAASYSNNIQQELYSSLMLDLTAPGTSFKFLVDPDKEDAGAESEVEIDIDQIVDVDDETFANDVIDQSSGEVTDIANDTQAEADSAYDSAILGGATVEQAEEAAQEAAEDALIDAAAVAENAGTPSTILETIVNNPELLALFSSSPELIEDINDFDITNIPTPATPEEAEALAAIIEVVEELLEDELKEDWDVEGNGDIDVEIDPADGQISIALEVTNPELNSPLEFKTLIDTPLFAFNINFNLDFETDSGSLQVWLENSLLGDFAAVDYFNQPTFISLLVTDESLFGLTGAQLKYSLYPGSPSAVSLQNINLTTVIPTDVPESSTLFMFFAGLLTLVNIRRNKA